MMIRLKQQVQKKGITWTLGVLFITFLVFKAFIWALSLGLPLCPEPVGTRSELFVEGANQTLHLTLFSGVLGLVIGLILGIGKLQNQVLIRLFSSVLIGLVRGTPLLVQIFFVYFALPALIPGLRLNEFFAAGVALAFNVGAYNAEVIRSGIIAIPRGQLDAAFSLGLSKWQTMRWVILPQGIKIVIPPLLNNLVSLLKDSSLASSIGLLELSLAGNRITSETFLPVPVLVTVSFIYLIQTLILSFVTQILARRLK